jgi:dCTP deaminase
VILTGPEIVAAVHRGDIDCTPFDEAHVGPASLDLTLSDQLLTYRSLTEKDWRWSKGALCCMPLDMAKERPTEKVEIPPHPMGFVLEPGVVYLGSTVERVGSARYASQIAGRSSVGRLGVSVHITAGFVDPGFFGTLTLEISVVQPVVIYPGIRVAQLVFLETTGRPNGYEGRYANQRGPQASRLWRDFLPASTP